MTKTRNGREPMSQLPDSLCSLVGHWGIRGLGHWGIGTLGHWDIGTLGHWGACYLEYSMILQILRIPNKVQVGGKTSEKEFFCARAGIIITVVALCYHIISHPLPACPACPSPSSSLLCVLSILLIIT
jgi:hypothetical protein